MAEVLLWRGADGSWAWRFRAPGERDVVANRTFGSREGAAASARRAYPGVPVRWAPGRTPPTRIPRSLLIAAVVAVGVLVARRRARAIVVRPVRGMRLEP